MIFAYDKICEFYLKLKQNQLHNCCHGNDTMGVIMFLLRCTLVVPSLKNTALIFLELLSIECCAVLVEPPMTSSHPIEMRYINTIYIYLYIYISSFAKYKNVNISKTKKDNPKRKTPFFFTLKSLSNKHQLFFTS